MLLLAVLIFFCTRSVAEEKELTFLVEDCEDYCADSSPFSLAFTRYFCPTGGAKYTNGLEECAKENEAEIADEAFPDIVALCYTGDKEITWRDSEGTEHKTVSAEIILENETIACREGNSDDSVDEGDSDNSVERVGGGGYTSCALAAYEACLEKDDMFEGDERTCHVDDQDEFWEEEKKCHGGAETVAIDGSYRSCLKKAYDVYQQVVDDRSEKCGKAYAVDYKAFSCGEHGGFGLVHCCCIVQGNGWLKSGGSGDDGGISGAAIIGAVIGGVLCFCACCAGLLYMSKKSLNYPDE